VKGMLIGNAKGYTKMVVRELERIGYRVQVFLVNAADCGVPQRRERVFFCCARNDLNVGALKLAPKHRWISSRESTLDLQAPTNDEIAETEPTKEAKEFWHYTKQGDSFAAAKQKKTGKANGFGRVRISENYPSCTLTSNAGDFYHWSECRKLTYREWKRLGSFPDDYVAKSDKIGKYMIGMSVPPKMTEEVARAVLSQWLGIHQEITVK
jgi:DNA (cytosine-5)-methyltransferase 1